MRKSTKRFLGGLALGAGALGAIGAVLMKNKSGSSRRRRREIAALENTWARPGMKVIFRAEVMPGRETSERTFRVVTLLPSGRVVLEGAAGEHAEKEFERVR
jgi:gas vesicle protein